MKKVITISLIMVVAFLSSAQNLLNQPQKIVIDAERNRYIVSMWQSGGDLVAIDSLGNQSYFVENAGMVDGMHIVGDTVYGSGPYPSGTVRGYDLETGDTVMDLSLSGAGVQHLSSFISDSLGILYTSERFGTRIFKINPKTQNYWVFADGNGIDEPNGLLYEPEKNRLLVCLDQPNPPILAISLIDSTISTVVTTNLEGSDGIARDMNGNYYITGYELPGIYKFDPDFSMAPELFFEGDYIIYPTYNEKNNSLLVTYYYQNNWGEVPLEYTSITSNEMKEEFNLNPSYPNPFSDITTISFKLDFYAHVKLVVHDTSGKTINILINEKKQPDTYLVSWNGTDKSGRQVSNGTYYFQLIVNSKTETQTVVLLEQ